MNIEKDFSLKKYNTFGIDIKTKIFVEVFSEEEVLQILNNKEYEDLPRLILGGGSNILFTKDFAGIVIKISIPGIRIISESVDEVIIEAGAGVNWHEFVLFCLEKNLGGVENLSLIPGTVGAAPMQNIGAYGVEVKDVFQSLQGINTETGGSYIYFKEDCNFGYRSSIFKQELRNKFIITYVTFSLKKVPQLVLNYTALKTEIEKLNLKSPSIKDVSEIVCQIRMSKLPDPAEIGNAGSFFKNPVVSEEKFTNIKENYSDVAAYPSVTGNVKIAAGWLIEKSGWKGKRVGNTGSHVKQSLVLVNYGNASGYEILALASAIKNSVYEKFDIRLEEEVNIV